MSDESPRGQSPREFLDRLRGALDELDTPAIEASARVILDAWRDDRRVYVMGNGGSAATASHLVCDLHNATRGHRRLGVFNLTDATPLLTALSNDLGYDRAFSEQVAASARRGDVVVVLSASGSSGNVVGAIRAAREAGARTVGILGWGGGAAAALVDVAVVLPDRHYGIVESAHAAIVHLIADLVRQSVALAPADEGGATDR